MIVRKSEMRINKTHHLLALTSEFKLADKIKKHFVRWEMLECYDNHDGNEDSDSRGQ